MLQPAKSSTPVSDLDLQPFNDGKRAWMPSRLDEQGRTKVAEARRLVAEARHALTQVRIELEHAEAEYLELLVLLRRFLREEADNADRMPALALLGDDRDVGRSRG